MIRNAEKQLRAALADTPVVLIHGPRQAGKSTLARAVCGTKDSRRYITLDDVTSLASAAGDPQGFIIGVGGPVVIDEVQRVPGLFFALKLAVDEDREAGRFLLTGSTDVMLLPQLSEALVGRIEIIPLWPLSQGEIEGRPERFVDRVFGAKLPSMDRRAKETPLDERILRGGFPEAVARRDAVRRSEWFASYVTTILDRGVRDLANIEGLAELPSLLSAVAAQTTGLMNFSNLSRGLSIPQTTLKRYLALLRATFMVVTIPAWFNNRGLRLTKSPKVILSDTGVACHLEHADRDRLAADGNLRGRMLENFVAMELMKQSSWSEGRPKLHHFRTSNGAEVDLVLEKRGGAVVGVEVKSSTRVDQHDFKGLRTLAEAAGSKFVRGIVLYNGDHVVLFGENMAAVPIGALWD